MVKKYAVLAVCLCSALFLVTGCGTTRIVDNTSINAYSLVTPPEHQLTTQNYLAENPGISQTAISHPDDEVPGYTTRVFYSSKDTAVDDGCGIKDRFDSKGLLAYYSEDRTKRLSLHTGGFDQAVVRYSFKLRNGLDELDRKEKKKLACLYDSRLQGILGSVYNEFHHREGKNAFDEVRDKMELEGLDFWH